MVVTNRRQIRNRWLVVGGCAAAALCLGVLGFHQYFVEQNEARPPWTLLYLALQLFTLSSGSVTGSSVPLALNIARFAAPAVAAWAGALLLLKAFRELLTANKINKCRNHVIVCGLGAKGLCYVRDFLKLGKVVVAIERNAENDAIASARALGAFVLVGDAVIDQVLQEARADRAERIIAITGDDFANIAICQQARIIAAARAPGTHDLAGEAAAGGVLHESHADWARRIIFDMRERAIFVANSVRTAAAERARMRSQDTDSGLHQGAGLFPLLKGQAGGLWRSITRESNHKAKTNRLDCHVHLNNRQVLEAAKIHERLWDKTEEFAPYLFSMYRHAAKLAFERKNLDWKPITRDSKYVVHLIIFGFGRMGENILLQAARIGHFANRKRLQVAIVDRLARKKFQAFTFRYPNIGKICDVDPLSVDAESPRVIDRVKTLAKDPNNLVSAVVCFGNDERSLAYGVSLAENMQGITFPILVCMPQRSLLCQALEESGQTPLSAARQLGGFGSCEDFCTAQMLIGREKDAIARKIHEFHRNEKLHKPGANIEELLQKPENNEWDLLREDFRESNIQQADHMPVKLRAVGLECRPYREDEAHDSSDLNIDAENLEALAIMEHNRWNAERWLAGWRHGTKDTQRKISDCLVEWEKLPSDPDAQEWDRDAIRNIPKLVKVMKA